MYDGKTIYGVNLEVMKLSGVNIDKLINRLYKGCKHYKDFKDYKLEVRNICTYLNSEMYATLFQLNQTIYNKRLLWILKK